VGDGRRQRVDADLPLLPGRDYRLWLAFDKPMRWRDADGRIANYRGQNVALTPAMVLEFPTLGGESLDVVPRDVTWLERPGGAAEDGYLRYRDDALAAAFTLPANLPLAASAPAVLAVTARDMIGAALDGDPATRADWARGHWVGYEDVDGNETDLGGPDCKFVTYAAAGDGEAPPAGGAGCRAASEAPDSGDTGATGGGGGGAALWLLALLGVGRLARRQAGG
jgi:hypothetical protein